ncbi:MAG: phosphoribosyltransferase family protein, partial [Nitrososphaeria archaeon]
DTVLQRVIAKQALNFFKNVEVTKILTVETNGIPIALQIGNEFVVDVIIARKERQIGFEKYIEAPYTLTPPTIKSLYIPKNALKKSDKVLVVDDLIRTGNTIKALISLVNKSGATLTGIFTVIDINQAMEKLKNELKINVPTYYIVSK